MSVNSYIQGDTQISGTIKADNSVERKAVLTGRVAVEGDNDVQTVAFAAGELGVNDVVRAEAWAWMEGSVGSGTVVYVYGLDDLEESELVENSICRALAGDGGAAAGLTMHGALTIAVPSTGSGQVWLFDRWKNNAMANTPHLKPEKEATTTDHTGAWNLILGPELQVKDGVTAVNWLAVVTIIRGGA